MNLVKSIFSLKKDTEAKALERARYQAFLSAFPGEYCGFGSDGSIAYSHGFLKMLHLEQISSFVDVQNVFSLTDSAVLESALYRLQTQKQKFALKLRLEKDGRQILVSGSEGLDEDEINHYVILWFEDIAEQEREFERLRDTTLAHEQTLRLMRASLDSFNWPIWIRDGRNQIIWANKKYCEILKAPLEAIFAEQKDLDFTKKQGQKSVAELSSDALTKAQEQIETRPLIMDGDRRLMQIRIHPVTHMDITICCALDVSREENLEREAERNLAANHELLEHLKSAIAIFGNDQRIEFHNSAYAQLWQLDDQWLNTHPKLGEILERLREMRRLPEQSDFRRYKQSWLDMFTTLIHPFEDMMYLPNGMALRALVMPHPLGGLMMTFEDVTSRLELESSYNTLVAVQKETLDNLAEGVAAFGGDGRLKLCNPGFMRLWNLNPEDTEGEPHVTRLTERQKNFFTPEHWNEARQTLLSQALSREMRDGMMRRVDGSVIEFAAVPLPDGGMLVTHIDITDTVRVENALREKTRALETAERLKLDFLANVSYQLRTPLNAIIGFTEILDKQYFGPLNNRQLEYTKGLAEAGTRLMNLINDILDLSTIEAGYMTLEKTQIDVFLLLKTIHELTQEWARSQKIEVMLDCAADIGSIEIDERRIKQVLVNLIRNAIEFTPAGGRIILKGQRLGPKIALSVIDTGPGIAKEDQERIFKPFEKTDERRDDGDGNSRGGAGLGLSLVKSIIELHKGEIKMDSEIGKGTAVTILLP